MLNALLANFFFQMGSICLKAVAHQRFDARLLLIEAGQFRR